MFKVVDVQVLEQLVVLSKVVGLVAYPKNLVLEQQVFCKLKLLPQMVKLLLPINIKILIYFGQFVVVAAELMEL